MYGYILGVICPVIMAIRIAIMGMNYFHFEAPDFLIWSFLMLAAGVLVGTLAIGWDEMALAIKKAP